MLCCTKKQDRCGASVPTSFGPPFPNLSCWQLAEDSDAGFLLGSQQLLWEVVAAERLTNIPAKGYNVIIFVRYQRSSFQSLTQLHQQEGFILMTTFFGLCHCKKNLFKIQMSVDDSRKLLSVCVLTIQLCVSVSSALMRH